MPTPAPASHTRTEPERAAPTGRRLGLVTATALVVASMIGTGVFTTSGLLLRELGSPAAVLAAWLVGGLLAGCGALTYAELVAALPRNGGEYQILSRTFHPAAGFVAGWVSLVVGFSAPIAASALAFGTYLAAIFPVLPPVASGALLVVALSTLHAVHVTAGSSFQNLFTIGKVLLIAGFVVGGLAVAGPVGGLAAAGPPLSRSMISPAFAVALILVSFAYSGWNGAAYIAGEVRQPARNLPLALLLGTALVMALYLGLNLVFLISTSPENLSGVVEVGHVAAVHLFGPGTGRLLSGLIAVALVSSVSAMTMAGPRVYQTMGEDYPRLGFLDRRNRFGAPSAAVGLQAAVTLLLLVTSTFEALLSYIGFTLSLCAGLAVVGVVVLRRREPSLPRPYRTFGYPVTPALFALLSLWMIVHTIWQRPVTALAGAATVVTGLVAYALVRRGAAESEAGRTTTSL